MLLAGAKTEKSTSGICKPEKLHKSWKGTKVSFISVWWNSPEFRICCRRRAGYSGMSMSKYYNNLYSLTLRVARHIQNTPLLPLRHWRKIYLSSSGLMKVLMMSNGRDSRSYSWCDFRLCYSLSKIQKRVLYMYNGRCGVSVLLLYALFTTFTVPAS